MRRSGRTTRIIDSLVQEIFNKPESQVLVIDHQPSRPAVDDLIHRLRVRMFTEHAIRLDVNRKRDGYWVKIKNENTNQ